MSEVCVIPCPYCGCREAWSTDVAATAAASWHLYEQHPLTWERIIGVGREPSAQRPEHLGVALPIEPPSPAVAAAGKLGWR